MLKRFIFTITLAIILLINPLFAFAQPISDNYYHHIHSFSVNGNNPKKPESYVYEYRHALQMGFSMVAQPIPLVSPYAEIGMLKNNNAAASSIRLRFDGSKKEYTYNQFYLGPFDPVEGRYRSVFEPDKHVGKFYPINDTIINFLKGYACARVDPSGLTVENITAQGVRDMLRTNWVTIRDDVTTVSVRSNWQSKKVAREMSQKAIDMFSHISVDGVFFDQFGAGVACINADFGDEGSYNSSLEGEKVFLSNIVSDLRQKVNRSGRPYFITVNIGSPYSKAGKSAAQFYMDNSLRLDFYYAESGNLRDPDTREFTDTLHANGIDPETGKPAFVHRDASENVTGYLPANKVGVDTEGGWYTSLGVPARAKVGRPYREDDYRDVDNCPPLPQEDDYSTQHLRALGIAANQGSWFGWYKGWLTHTDNYICENEIPRLKTDDDPVEIVYTNDRQLMQSIPNWDNLLDIPIPEFGNPQPDDERKWNEAALIYQSTNSYASKDVIYSKHPYSNELFVVFTDPDGDGDSVGEVILNPGETVTSAYFVNEYFEKTMEDALGCLNINTITNIVTLNPQCSHKLKTGIRISSTQEPYANGLVSHWSFDEDTGDAIDTVSGHHGKLVNGATRETGISGNALKLDGEDDFVFVGDVLDMHTSEMSISFWVKTETAKWSVAVSKANNTPFYNTAVRGNGQVRAFMHNGDTITQVDSLSTVNDGEWHHVAAVFERDEQLYIYIDGVEEGSVDISADVETLISNPNPLSFGTNCKFAEIVDGKCKDDSTNNLPGSLDEIKIFNKALSAQDVMDLYKEFTAVDGDADGDGDVDIADYSIWLSEYGGNPPQPIYDPDFNDDGDIDGQDFIIWLNNYGT